MICYEYGHDSWDTTNVYILILSDGNVYICNSLFVYDQILTHLLKLMDSIEPNLHKLTRPLCSRCLTAVTST